MTSWKTTLAGILTIVGALIAAAMTLLDGNPNTNPDIASVIISITAGVGLISARDNKVSDEHAGAGVTKP